MGIKTVPQPPYSPDLAPCDFWLFPKLRGCGYEKIEEMKEAVRKVIDTLTEEDFYGPFQKLLERYKKCIAARRDYLEGDRSFMSVLSIKVPIQKSLETYWRHLVYIRYAYVWVFLRMCVLIDEVVILDKPSENMIRISRNEQIYVCMYVCVCVYIRMIYTHSYTHTYT